jgi:glycosyltransferase involved in cell wall biosynthesis
MKIALLGTRGIPSSYSGFETCAEELGARLVERGHQVTVYCRSHHIRYAEPTYRGIRLIKLPTIPNKYLDTLVHSFLSSLHALGQGYDICLYFIAGNSPVTFIPRLAGSRTALNVDGLDWKRQKWNAFAKRYIRFAEYLATKLPNAVVTDSRAVQQYYRETYRAETNFIAYGADVTPLPPGKYLQRFGLAPRQYILYVGRLVPENCAHHLTQAMQGLKTDMKCVIVGDAPYAEKYIAELKASVASAGPQVVFTGYLFGEGYRELGSNAFAFVETSEVGGTHPALLEAMAFGNCVIANDTPENLETIGSAGLSYRGAGGADALRQVLRGLLDAPEVQIEGFRRSAFERAVSEYSWAHITDQYEQLFTRLTQRRGMTSRAPNPAQAGPTSGENTT